MSHILRNFVESIYNWIGHSEPRRQIYQGQPCVLYIDGVHRMGATASQISRHNGPSGYRSRLGDSQEGSIGRDRGLRHDQSLHNEDEKIPASVIACYGNEDQRRVYIFRCRGSSSGQEPLGLTVKSTSEEKGLVCTVH